MVIIALYVYDVRKFRLRVLHYTTVEDRVLEDSVASGDRFLFFLSFLFLFIFFGDCILDKVRSKQLLVATIKKNVMIITIIIRKEGKL